MYPQLKNRGMTHVELISFILLVILFIFGALQGNNRIDHWYGFIIGGTLGVFIAFVCVCIIAFISDIWNGTGMPRCANGCCRGPGYLFSDDDDYDIREAGDEYFRVCKCGDRYIRSGRRFLRVDDDGNEIPYMIWRPFRGWFPDEDGKKK